MSEITLLCVVAHPDDETFGAGGALVHAVQRGAKVVTVCATRGEAGEILDRSNATPETLAAVREREYRQAGHIMGVSESILLDYLDSGMQGSPENENPGAFIRQPRDKVVADIIAVMKRVKPDIVLSSDAGGGYGHPDHVFASQCAKSAFEQMQEQASENGWAPSKLYYYTFSTSLMRRFFTEMAERQPDSDLANLNPDDFGTADDEITLTIDTTEHKEQLREAFEAHLSQMSPLERVSDETGSAFLSQTALLRVYPEPVTAGDESDLFAGL